MTRQVFTYELRDRDGTVIDRGSARELSERHFFSMASILEDAKHEHVLNGRYRVVRVGKQETAPPEMSLKVKECREQGMKEKDIAQKLGITRSAVVQRIYRLRQRGLME